MKLHLYVCNSYPGDPSIPSATDIGILPKSGST